MGRYWVRQTIVGALATLFVWLFWLSRPTWSWDMRLWKAFGDSALMLLFLTLLIGPVARLWPIGIKLISWRKYVGIWFGIMALIHGFLVWDGWARWEISRFFGYEFIPEIGRTVRIEPGFGLANLIGVIALFFTVVLMVTSSKWAIKYLGAASWKWLHYSANTIFYLSSIHTAYFLYIHYTLSFHKNVPPPDWFRIPFLLLVGVLLTLQIVVFMKIVMGRKGKKF